MTPDSRHQIADTSVTYLSCLNQLITKKSELQSKFINTSMNDETSIDLNELTAVSLEDRAYSKWWSQESWRRLLKSHDDKFRYAVTLTFRHAVSPSDASQALKNFITKMNRAVYGRKFAERKQFINIIPILEGADDSECRIHYHALIGSEVGNGRSLGEVTKLITEKWGSLIINDKKMTRVEVIDAWQHIGTQRGWLRYSSKDTHKSLSAIAEASYDSVDVANLNHPIIPKK